MLFFKQSDVMHTCCSYQCFKKLRSPVCRMSKVNINCERRMKAVLPYKAESPISTADCPSVSHSFNLKDGRTERKIILFIDKLMSVNAV